MDEPSQLRADAETIWSAGVTAVESERLVADSMSVAGDVLGFSGHECQLHPRGRICVVGAGKAGAGMAAGFESVLAAQAPDLLARVEGLVNVPADCVRPLSRITLHAARPAGLNEPTDDGVLGAQQITNLAAALGNDDLCVVLLSGGGSALLPSPIAGVSLADKQQVTRLLMNGGADIGELNCVRRHLSRLKGGGLVRATRAGTIISLIISDVVGDPLQVIASGPTVADTSSPQDALEILRPFGAQVPQNVLHALSEVGPPTSAGRFERVSNIVIGNNRTALDACSEVASRSGYRVLDLGSDRAGVASDVGRDLADLARSVRDRAEPVAPPACILSGGEPVVNLTPVTGPRKGGRNQEVALAALQRLGADGARICVLSGGTDGEDGPTDAAGAVVTTETARLAAGLGLDPAEYLAANNSYPFLDATSALLRTGPTHTNVMDIRVVLIGK